MLNTFSYNQFASMNFNNFPYSPSSQIFWSQIILTHCLNMYIFLFISAGREDQRKACHGIWIWPSCAFTEKTKSCKGKHFQWYVCVGLSTLTELYCSYILHSMWYFLNFALHIPRPHQEEPPEKSPVEVVIIHTIYQVSKFIWHFTSVLIQNSTTFTFYDCCHWPLPQLSCRLCS